MFRLVNDADPHDSIDLTADTYEKALEEALEELGWFITEDKNADGKEESE